MRLDLTGCPPNVLALENMCLSDLRGRDVSRDVVVIPIGPLENHGTHLPIGTDIYIAEELAKRTASRFAVVEPDARMLIYPAITVASATIRGTGSFKVTSRQLRAALNTLCGRFMMQGYRRFVLLSGHGGVPFVGALDAVCDALNARGARAIAPCAKIAGHAYQGAYIGRIRALGAPVPDDAAELFEQDLHAGFMETALMLAIAPELVGDRNRSVPRLYAPRRAWLDAVQRAVVALARVLPLKPRTREGVVSGSKAGAVDLSWIIRGRSEGYLGDPAGANAEFGEALLEVMAEDLAGYLIDVFHNGADPADYRSGAYLFNRLKWIGLSLLIVAAALVCLSIR